MLRGLVLAGYRHVIELGYVGPHDIYFFVIWPPPCEVRRLAHPSHRQTVEQCNWTYRWVSLRNDLPSVVGCMQLRPLSGHSRLRGS
jgi:hypothetical protein